MDTSKYPLHFQIAIIVLTAFFLWSFSIAREPRGWRRLYQSIFGKSETFSVNKNKVIDESLKRYGIFVAMAILVADVVCVVMMVTHPLRMKQASKEQLDQQNEMNRVIQANPEAARVGILPK